MKNLRGMDPTTTPKNLALTERQWSCLEGHCQAAWGAHAEERLDRSSLRKGHRERPNQEPNPEVTSMKA